MKGKGQHHRKKRIKNYLQVLEVLKNKQQTTPREIRTELLKTKGKEDAPVERTIYRVLKQMVRDKIARKEGRDYLYSPHDILRDRWLDAFDIIFKALVPQGYDLPLILQTQAFVITPRNIGFCEANPKQMKQLIDDFELAPPGQVIGRVTASSAVEKGQPVSIVPRDMIEQQKK